MPPTRTRAATSAAVRPVRIAIATRSGRVSATRASLRSARRASGTIVAAPGSREPWARVPSKSATIEQPAGPAGQRGDGGDHARRRIPLPVGSSAPGQGVTSTPGRTRSIVPPPDLGHRRRRGGLADVEGGGTRRAGRAARRDEAPGCRAGLAERGAAAATRSARARRWARPIPRPTGRPSGARRGRRRRRRRVGGQCDEPSEHQRRDGDPDHEAGDDRQASPHTGRSVPVRAVDGSSAGPLLRCRSDGHPRPVPHADRARRPHRARRRIARRWPAVVHEPGHRRPRRDPDRDASPVAAVATPEPAHLAAADHLERCAVRVGRHPGRSDHDPGSRRRPEDRPAGHRLSPTAGSRPATSR